MKTTFNLVLVLLMVLTFISCNKKEYDYDFRDAFVGRFDGVYSVQCSGPCPCENKMSDTTIVVSKGSSNNTILVLNQELIYDVDEGYFYSTVYPYRISVDCETLSYFSRFGGLGCSEMTTFYGSK